MTDDAQLAYERGIRDAIDSLEDKGYRDPIGRCAEAHLAIVFFEAMEHDYPNDAAADLSELRSWGRL